MGTIAVLEAVPIENWNSINSTSPHPQYWDQEVIKTILDIAENTMKEAVEELKLRARILRKERAIGLFPGGIEMVSKYPIGHGSKKLKREALDEVVMRVLHKLKHHDPQISLPYCVFNGGTDAWVDIGNKSVGVSILQHYFDFPKNSCLHVGDQVRIPLFF